MCYRLYTMTPSIFLWRNTKPREFFEALKMKNKYILFFNFNPSLYGAQEET